MTNTLVTPAELADFPGAPFTAAIVDAVVDGIREDLGWHVAPEVTETLTVDGTTDRELILPTLKVGEITEIRDVTDPANPVVLTGWRKNASGSVFRAAGWPLRHVYHYDHNSHHIDLDDVIEVDLTHGFEDAPASMLTAIAALCQVAKVNRLVTQEVAGPFSVIYATAQQVEAWGDQSPLDLFRVRAGF